MLVKREPDGRIGWTVPAPEFCPQAVEPFWDVLQKASLLLVTVRTLTK